MRGLAVVVVVAATSIVAALGMRYAGEGYPRWLDQVALTLARDWFPVARRPARLVIGLFDPVPLGVLVAALTGVCLALKRRRLAVLAVAGPVVSGLATTLLKPLIERTKNGDLVYPSGHMAACVAVALVLALLLVSLGQPRPWVRIAVLTAIPAVAGAGMGLAMTVTNYHYLTDAVGGFCVAVAVVTSLALLLDRWPVSGSHGVRPPRTSGNAARA
jgi:undecaprenyl-diphosphatase